MKAAFYTLGCKVNQYETQAMEQLLSARGHEIVSFSDPADVYVVNSCSVTAVSDQKSRQMLSRVRREHPEALLALCGCYAQTHAEEVRKLNVDVLGGSADRAGFIADLEAAYARREDAKRAIPALPRTFEPLPSGAVQGRTRAMLKVEDGCVNFCAYCIIPYARGPVRSMPLEDAVREAEKLARAGFREIVLTGIEISSWGRDFRDGTSLIDLMEAVSAAAPKLRLRLGSLEPRTVTPEFCARAKALPRLCPQFHLSLQSGCDATLARMRRKYDTARYFESVHLLRESFADPAITTDLITGFPEETEAEFSETLAFIRRCGFARMHVFPYSIRPGTAAAKMAQVPKAVKDERAARARAAAAEMTEAYLARQVGSVGQVLFEEEKSGLWSGHLPNYTQVLCPGTDLHNVEAEVRIEKSDGAVLYGSLIGKS